MSNFSLFSLFTAGLACMIPLSAAYTQPKGDAPKGNPIYEPGLNSVVPVGEGFTITWDPTTQGTVTLVLLKGPSENAVPQYPIVEKTPNNGTFVWVPKTSLEPSDPSTPAKGYGIQLIDDATGQYQYTTQFGISNDKYDSGASESSSSHAASGYSSHSSTSTLTPPTYPTPPTYSSTTKTVTPPAYSPSNLPKPTWYTTKPVHNVTMVAPTYPAASSTISTSWTAPAGPSATSNTTAPSGPTYVGSASNVAASFAGLVFAAGVAVLAL